MSRHRFSWLTDRLVSGATWRRCLFVLCCCAALPGCLLFNWSSTWLTGEVPSTFSEPSANVLGKIPTSKTAVALEIVFVERPIDDPLMGDQLWSEVDQIGSLPADVRQKLNQMGFRVGRVGANPPRALQTLMGLSTEVGNEDEKRLVGRRVVLPSGAETEINTGQPQFRSSINVPAPKGMELKTFENVRGVFRLKAKRLQEGWARIELLPEIHHGRMTNRPVAVRGGWQLQTTQAIERLYNQQFSLDLNLGEMVVITGNVEPADSVGRHFFHAGEYSDTDMRRALAQNENGQPPFLPEDLAADPTLPSSAEQSAPESGSSNSTGIQRLLIVRLADLSTAESIYSED